MRLVALALLALALAAPASAAAPRFGLFDLDASLASASHNVYGDVKVSSSATALAKKAPRAAIVRCGDQCRLGRGWLAFAKAPLLTARDLTVGKAHLGRRGWSISVTLTAHGRTAWARARRDARLHAARAGLPLVYAIVIDGTIYALPFASDLTGTADTVELTGFTRAGARQAVRLLG